MIHRRSILKLCSFARHNTSATDYKRIKIDKCKELIGQKINPYEYNYSITHSFDELHSLHKELEKGKVDPVGAPVSIAGRVMLRREFGKLCFLTLDDSVSNKTLQAYIDFKHLGAER